MAAAAQSVGAQVHDAAPIHASCSIPLPACLPAQRGQALHPPSASTSPCLTIALLNRLCRLRRLAAPVADL
mgnify:CR=1 FL=1